MSKPRSSSASSAPEVHPKSRSRRRFAVLGALFGVVAIAALVGLLLPRWLAGSGAKAEPSVWQGITAGIKDGAVPKDVALEAFAYLYKVDIPGVTVPKGIDAADRPTSGSGALRWVKANWSSLTQGQQAVITGVMTPHPNDVVVTIDVTTGEVTPATAATGGRRGGAGLGLAIQPPALFGGAGAGDAPSPQIKAAIHKELIDDIHHIGTKLKLPVISEGFGLWKNITLDVTEKSGNGTLMTAAAEVNLAGHYNPCAVTVYKEAWQDETASSLSATFHVLMTHEVIHCFQHVVEGDVDTANAVPPWITEGTAIWLAASDTGTEEPMLPSTWANGYFYPEKALTNRSYDAFGYYALLDHLGRDMWGNVVGAWKAAATGSQRSNAFIGVLNGDAPDVRNVWASSYLRELSWGDPWIAYGFGIPGAAQVSRHTVAATKGGSGGSLQPRSNTVLNVESAEGEIVAVDTSGLASVHDNYAGNALDFQNRTFCVGETCKCPAGTPRAGQDAADQKLGLPFVVALNAPQGGSTYSISSRTLEEACGKQPTPRPSQGPCLSGCAGSNGDPHLSTVNNYRYDFQGAGEFTLLRSPNVSLEIQARQEPYSMSGPAQVAINTAIAVKAGAHRVGIYAVTGGLQVRVDGAVVDATSSQDLGGGASIAPYPKGLVIAFADGTKLWALNVSPYGINVLVLPSSDLRATGVGLLGPIVPGGLGVPALPDGTRLPVAADRHARHAVVYGQFADAWRVTDSTSLFDYDSGKSTTSYTQKGYPADTADLILSDLTVEQRSAGDTACATIADQGLHDSCVFDVAVSGDSGFATSYTPVQGLYDSGILAPTPGPSGSGVVTTPGPGQVSGAIAITPASRLGGYAVGPDDKLYVSARVSPDKVTLFAVDPPTGTIVAKVDVPTLTEVHVAGGSVWLPGLKTNSSGHICSVTRFDASTLAEQATVAIKCGVFDSPETVSDGAALWFVDVSKYDGGTSKGAVLTRIDPSSNALGPSVDLPFINGNRRDSTGGLLYFGTTDSAFYELKTGDTAMTKLAPWAVGAHPGGAGLWIASQDGRTAHYFSDAGGPQVSLPVDGSLVAGDAGAAYVERSVPSGTELWRYPADGSAPALLTVAPKVDGDSLGYFADPQAVVAPDGLIKLWMPSPSGDNPQTLYYQWVPLP